MSQFAQDRIIKAKLAAHPTRSCQWVLPTEVPIGFVYNGHPHAVMMATPADLEDFALGFCLAEGVLHRADELEDIQIRPQQNGIEIYLKIPQKRLTKLKMHGQRRAHRGRAGCGICGVDRLSDALRPLPRLADTEPAPTPTAMLQAIKALPDQQPMRANNHTVHGAAWVDFDGNLLLVREDIGRHNALDKMIGARAKISHSGFALLSSRCTYELVQKSALAGIKTLLCLAAPTTSAVKTASKSNLRLYIYDRRNNQILDFSC